MRGRGISHQLVDATIAEARRQGVQKLGLRALSTNTAAVTLHQQHGFALRSVLVPHIFVRRDHHEAALAVAEAAS